MGRGWRRKGGRKIRKSGFSLIEVVVAQALLSLGLLSIAHLFGLGVWHGVQARTQSLSATLAQQKMEALAGQYAAGIALTGGEDRIQVENLAEAGQVLMVFRRAWSVQSEARGASIVQVKVIPQPAASLARPGVMGSQALLLRAVLVPRRL